ncbi:MAG: NAD(P)/FAD-dependent oxidoreductase [Deltaproteobacteria bacterium]|nr:NAD(P)/FAD-dependent oxidoreductase [Deltaproteobacteria bacterium]
MNTYNVIIVGAGPAGIFAALELLAAKKNLKILLLEKGDDLPDRKPYDIFQGWGGAGTFSDGKLNLSTAVGGFLTDYIGEDALESLIDYVDKIFIKYGAPAELHGTDEEEIKRLEEVSARNGLKLVPFKIRHLGTDRCFSLLKNIREEITPPSPLFIKGGQGGVDIQFNCAAIEILKQGDKTVGLRTAEGREFLGDFIILAPGRSGSHWLSQESKKLGLSTGNNPVDIGVRVEVPASIMRPLTDVMHEAKLLFYSKRFDDLVRTFCMNPYGVVVKEKHKDFCTVNGHSFSTKKSNNTNFAILASTTFTEPFHEPIAYGQYIAKLVNLLGEGIIVQRLGDLLQGRRSTPERIKKGSVKPTLADATPGDLSFAIPYRYISDILEMLEALDKIAPGVYSTSTLLYGAEVKFYSMRLKLTNNLETEVKNLFAAGDGAGITRGIIHAAVSGVVAAREILKRAT